MRKLAIVVLSILAVILVLCAGVVGCLRIVGKHITVSEGRP